MDKRQPRLEPLPGNKRGLPPPTRHSPFRAHSSLLNENQNHHRFGPSRVIVHKAFMYFPAGEKNKNKKGEIKRVLRSGCHAGCDSQSDPMMLKTIQQDRSNEATEGSPLHLSSARSSVQVLLPGRKGIADFSPTLTW